MLVRLFSDPLFFPEAPGREPTVIHQGGGVLLHIPLSDQGLERRAPKRWLAVPAETIAAVMGADAAARMTDRQRTAFVRNNIARIRRGLVERFGALSDASLTDPATCGLPGYIEVVPGDF